VCVGGREDCEWEQGMEEEIGYNGLIFYVCDRVKSVVSDVIRSRFYFTELHFTQLNAPHYILIVEFFKGKKPVMQAPICFT